MAKLSIHFQPLALGVALAALPAAFSWTLLAPVALHAQADPGGNGNGNGNGGANGNGGNGGGNGNGGNGAGGEHSGHAYGHATDDDGEDDGDVGGAALLGSLNALHASPNAFLNADPESMVGMVGAYQDAIAAGDLETAASLLDDAANKPVTLELLQEVNARLGIVLDAATEESLAALAVEE
jgi:hypothetical protein